MAFCKNCGVALDDNAKFCTNCGASQDEETVVAEITAEEIKTEEIVAPAPEKASGTLNMGMLIWAIINLVTCCMPLGIAGLLLTIFAKDAPSAEEEAKKLKTAKTCNLIGSIAGVVYIVFCIVIGVLSVLLQYE